MWSEGKPAYKKVVENMDIFSLFFCKIGGDFEFVSQTVMRV